jgi:hypothetical protein
MYNQDLASGLQKDLASGLQRSPRVYKEGSKNIFNPEFFTKHANTYSTLFSE